MRGRKGGAMPCDDCGDSGWEECWECAGVGWVHDCGEDTCCCADPDEQDVYECEACDGEGGWDCHCTD